MNKETKSRKSKRENIIDEDIDLFNFFELASSDKIYVTTLNPHEIKKEILQDFRGDFELNGLMVIGTVENKTNTSLRNMDDFGNCNNATDVDYDSEDVTFTGYVFE